MGEEEKGGRGREGEEERESDREMIEGNSATDDEFKTDHFK